MTKPTLFVGSSSENVRIAYAIQENLDDDADVTVWNQGIFEAGHFNLESLLTSLEHYDFGVFVCAPDDLTRIRGEDHRTVRDNVVFELGLFVGRLGRERSFILMPRGVDDLHIPSDLFGLTVLQFQAERQDRNLRAALGPACNKIRDDIRRVPEESRPRLPAGIRLVHRDQFSKLLLERLEDPKVRNVRLISYTGEVDTGLLNNFHVKGPKKIEVYKRSVLADLREEQEYNVRSIAEGLDRGIWRKRLSSMDVSEQLAKGQRTGWSVEQYLYDAIPSKRAYVFDDNEAIFAYYEIVPTAAEGPDSLYRGISSSTALHVTRETPLGQHLLDELGHYLAGMRRSSRQWDVERALMSGERQWMGPGHPPCLRPGAVLLDLDGVLYDSMPFYVQAWLEAFAGEGIKFPELRVYLEEGRDGRETITRYFTEENIHALSSERIERILKKRDDVLARLGVPPPMPGAKRLLEAIRTSKLPAYIVTGSTNQQHIDALKEIFPGLIDRACLVMGQEVMGKPSPEPYLLASKRASVLPYQAISIENAPLGIRSADAAGTFCIAVKTGKLGKAELEKEGPRAVFSSCDALAERWEAVLNVLR